MADRAPNSFYASGLAVEKPVDYHVVFITGNPGRVEYYHSFLAELHRQLNQNHSPGNRSTAATFSVYSASLPNFANDNETSAVLGLRGIIDHVEAQVKQYVDSTENANHLQADKPTVEPRLVVVGHSVGAYIGLELLRRRKVAGFVGLWPTVAWISKSQNGRIATPLLNLPGFIIIVVGIAHLLRFLPNFVLRFLIQQVTGFPNDAAEVTANFLKSRRGIHQALHMARDEMNQIREDTWPDQIWTSRLAFHFGAKDHWVAEMTREELVANRGSVIMQVDTDNIPHAFCIRDSVKAADIAARLIKDVLALSGENS